MRLWVHAHISCFGSIEVTTYWPMRSADEHYSVVERTQRQRKTRRQFKIAFVWNLVVFKRKINSRAHDAALGYCDGAAVLSRVPPCAVRWRLALPATAADSEKTVMRDRDRREQISAQWLSQHLQALQIESCCKSCTVKTTFFISGESCPRQKRFLEDCQLPYYLNYI